MQPSSLRLPALLVLVLVAALCGARVGRGQDAPAAAPAERWDYRTLFWEDADTREVLQEVTGDTELESVQEMARKLTGEHPLSEDPRVLVAIQHRLQARLQQAGAEGWEAFWVREGVQLVGGASLPVPTVLLKRRAE